MIKPSTMVPQEHKSNPIASVGDAPLIQVPVSVPVDDFPIESTLDHFVDSDVSDVELIIPSPRSHSLLLGINQHQSSVNEFSKNVPQEHERKDSKKSSNKVSKVGSPCVASLEFPLFPVPSSHETDTSDVLSDTRFTSSVKKLCLKSKYLRTCKHRVASKPNAHVLGEHNTTIIYPDAHQSINVNNDVPKVDLIASSSSHLPSSAINQPWNIDLNTQKNRTACMADFPVANTRVSEDGSPCDASLVFPFPRLAIKTSHEMDTSDVPDSTRTSYNVKKLCLKSKFQRICRHSGVNKSSANVLENVQQNTMENIDVPEVDLIASSSSHLPSSAINQSRNIDIDLKRNQTFSNKELPNKRVKFIDKTAESFTGDRVMLCTIVSEEVNLSSNFAQDAPT